MSDDFPVLSNYDKLSAQFMLVDHDLMRWWDLGRFSF